MLERLTAETFAPLVGDTFLLDADDAGRLDLELVESRVHHAEAPAGESSGARAPFSLLFLGPADPVLPQRIYHLEHESTGPLEIFIVPVARHATGTTYEAVFG